MTDHIPDGWTFTVNAFNWTQDVLRADEPAPEVAVRIAAEVSPVLEVEPGQLWRTFPSPLDGEVDALRADLDAVGGTVSIAGASIDEWSTPTRCRSPGERLEFLSGQLRAAHRLGASGVRLPLGQAGRPLLDRVLPILHELELTLYEEIQGAQSPAVPAQSEAIDTIADIGDERVRLLVDISMLMPALPVTYLRRLRDVDLPEELIDQVTNRWLDPVTPDVLRAYLADGRVPLAIRSLYINMLTRFGRSSTADLAPLMPLVGAFHLKFWDLHDADDRITRPLEELGALLSASQFSGYLCSEWGGFEWLDGHDASDTTRTHLTLARTALGRGAAPTPS